MTDHGDKTNEQCRLLCCPRAYPHTTDECGHGTQHRDPQQQYRPAFGEPVTEWFRWFAWRPVETVDRGWRWLCPVWRRRIQKHDYLPGGSDFWWQHAVAVAR